MNIPEMKYRPTLTDTEIDILLRALQQSDLPESEVLPLIRKLDLLVYKSNKSNNTPKPAPKITALNAMMLERYMSFESLETAKQEMSPEDIALALQHKPAKELTNQEINFIGQFIISQK